MNMKDAAIPEKTLAFFAEIIKRELGIIYSSDNYFGLEARIRELTRTSGLGTVDDLLRIFVENSKPEMRAVLLEMATNNETSFFRDPPAFQALTEIFETQAAKPPGRLRIWSAACSYGQEPYTIAMIMDGLARSGKPIDYQLLATDYAKKAIDYSEAGVYSDLQVKQGLPEDLLSRHFRPSSASGFGAWTVESGLKRNISFRRLNLLDSFDSLGRFHIILCRNVLIYQSVENKKMILKKLYDRLEPGGYLLMGAGESLIGITDQFEIERVQKANFYRRVG